MKKALDKADAMIMKMIYFEQGKLVFQVFLIVVCQWSFGICQFNLYDTDRSFPSDSLQFDCLNYYTRRQTRAYQELSDIVDEIIPYCPRPINKPHESLEEFDESLHQKLSFKELSRAHITAQQLFSWSISTEIIERYQNYLGASNTTLDEHFYNCTLPYFGPRCQYSFEFGKELSFNDIVELAFREREAYPEETDMTVQVPCYVLLECHRNGQSWCLDWREVCDGTIDCFDEGSDEQLCFNLEINRCNDDEFRCQNGLCISHELWEDGEGETDCLDQSDRVIDVAYSKTCYRDPTFLCEEHSCGPNDNPFSCGDGECVPKFQQCHNGRHMLLLNLTTAQGDLNNECWSVMICLTQLTKKVNGMPCEMWLAHNDTVVEILKQCGSFFSFPTVPIHSNHIYFFYENPYLKFGVDQLFLPDYICYNPRTCDSFTADIVYEDKACFDATRLFPSTSEVSYSWDQRMMLTAWYFRSCLTFSHTSYESTEYANHSSLYHCHHSVKLISKHRIMDGMRDCLENDDEEYANSCQLNDRYRVTCINTSNCWSPLLKNYACTKDNLQSMTKIQFQRFCDGIDEFFYGNDSEIYSDELGCGSWICNNLYTRCNGYWACDDGRDEYNCTQTKCPSTTYPCISPDDYNVTCLPSESVNDDVSNCIGALDEQLVCRVSYLVTSIVAHFLCSNKYACISMSQICDNKEDCSTGDDEDKRLCESGPFVCDKDATHDRSSIEEVVCALRESENSGIRYFSVSTSSSYPVLATDTFNTTTLWSTDHHPTKNLISSPIKNNKWPWYCHRGLLTHIWSKNNSNNKSICICPPSYYGDRCEYQNQRVSLTLRLTSNNRHATYAVVSMLVDDTDEQHLIHAYDQFTYIAKRSCSMKLNRYLLFQSQPKDVSRNYSVRIDVYEKNTMVYVGTWHFPITFLFLPVNRLSVAISLSNHHLQYSSNCLNKCVHGECLKYVNKPVHFCRCSTQWSGVQCDIPLQCQACSSHSTCIGSANNRSICVCPIDRYGRQCSFASECPPDWCQNKGQCIPADLTIPGSVPTCVCTDQYFGTHCEHRKAQLDVSFDNVNIPRYLIAYFFTLSNQSDPIETTVLRKLAQFQRTVTFHVAVPYQLVFIQTNGKFYLVLLQHSPRAHAVTSINSRQECLPAQQLLNSTVMQMISYQRVVHFHWLCYTNYDVTCFMDKTYLCLCTRDHHANCIEFNPSRDFSCPLNSYCKNNEQCLQDHPYCPSTRICLCQNCFFGSQCQFYAKALGATLDEILGYEFRRNQSFRQQSIRVIMAAVLTGVVFLIGIINSILAIIIFSRPKPNEVGCGRYLLASSITSLLVMITIVLKFCFLFYSHRDHKHTKWIKEGNCRGIEIILKIFLYSDSWLNACIAVERTISVLQGITFDRKRSQKVANKVILILLLIIGGSLVPQFINLKVFYDETEERSWCVIRYSKWLSTYSSALILIHYFLPLIINIVSIILIIIFTTRHLSHIQSNHSMWVHLRSRIKKQQHIIISSTIIVVLTLPHLIGSLAIECRKTSDLFWFYLISYILSFLPAAFVFIIFVSPSTAYKEEFSDFVLHIRRRIAIMRLNL